MTSPVSRAQARFLKDGCNRCHHMRSSHVTNPEDGDVPPPFCRSCVKSYPQGAHHPFEEKQYEEISDYTRAGYTDAESRDNLEAERD